MNLKNDDDKCFIYCLGRALDPTPEKKDLERVSTHLKNVCESLGLNNIKTPVNVHDLPKIDGQFNVSINLYDHSDSNKNPIHIYPIRTTLSRTTKHVDLLIITNSETNHYVWIKNFNKLCTHVTTDTSKKFFCKHCMQHFLSEDELEKHMIDCIVFTKCKAIEIPTEGEITKFKSFRETVKISFVIHADLKSLLQKLTATQKQETGQGMKPDSTEK